jgi:DNA-binding MarR family transcriptional regulator
MMETEKQAQLERLSQIADRMATKMHGPALDEWSELELTMPQLRAIGYLGQGSRRMSDLAAYLGISVSSATSLIERLEGKGLVARVHDPVDRRVVMCHLTAPGEVELARFWRVRRSHLEALAEILTSDELTRVIEVMELMVAAFERHSRNQEGAGTGRMASVLAVQ